MDPAWEVAVFQRQLDTLDERREDNAGVSVREASSHQRRPTVWWRRQLFWVLVAVACMLVLLVLAAYQLRPKRVAREAFLYAAWPTAAPSWNRTTPSNLTLLSS
ncbi:uncharacterized protein [Dermacentor albipictus]|uniref:uncharacterized protein n=1 Tax=Dermacentor albipictus TaxID=60249 RepID=UPI0038FC4573